MAEGHRLPASAADVEQALRQLVASSMVELLHDAQGRRRYRLHELIRLYGVNRLAEAGEEGRAGLATWRRRFVQYTTLWLSEQDRCFQSAEAEVCLALHS